MWRNSVRGIGNEAQVGFMILVQGSRDADDHRIHINDPGVVGRSRKALRLGCLDLFRADAVDVRSALSERVYFALVNVEAGNDKLLFAEQQGQRQSHVAQPDDADSGFTLLDLVLESID